MKKKKSISAIVRYTDAFVFPSGVYGNIEVMRGKSLEEIRERAEQTAKENNVKVAAIAE
ncbi:hypothetical protein LKD81_16790 [Lachnospiraceae bacterium CLA-AA-H215]|uniref:Uncharacterized protein n=1 Tax=Hominifimenecus microfluidus TaxID=2885348 RepID=A0AAE3ECM0_9FIRM|nr:hypothetical protein [Hominifimenecus microfluidus]MCC2232626.1 hypothetical protein [Hominifimenecus microfluidus]